MNYILQFAIGLLICFLIFRIIIFLLNKLANYPYFGAPAQILLLAVIIIINTVGYIKYLKQPSEILNRIELIPGYSGYLTFIILLILISLIYRYLINRCYSLRDDDIIPADVLTVALSEEHGICDIGEHYTKRFKAYEIINSRRGSIEISHFVDKFINKIVNKLNQVKALYLCSGKNRSNTETDLIPLIQDRNPIEHIIVTLTNVSGEINPREKVVLIEPYLFDIDRLCHMIDVLTLLGANIVCIFILFYSERKKKLVSELRRRKLDYRQICLGWFVDVGKHLATDHECKELRQSLVKISYEEL